jgi:hypothetical protein
MLLLLRRATAVAAFVPTDIAGLQLWLKADSLSLNDADPVTTWADQSGNGRDAGQAVAANKPIYKVNIVNGKPVVRFDGVNDVMTTAASFGVRTIFYAVTYTSGVIWGSSLDLTYFGVNVATHYLYMGPGGGGVTTVGDEPGAWHIWTGKYSSGAGQGIIRLDGTQAGTGTHEADTATGTTFIGNRELADLPLAGDLAELIGYSGYLSDANCLSVERYLGTKYGITVA